MAQRGQEEEVVGGWGVGVDVGVEGRGTIGAMREWDQWVEVWDMLLVWGGFGVGGWRCRGNWWVWGMILGMKRGGKGWCAVERWTMCGMEEEAL